jgi:hypothetical protein
MLENSEPILGPLKKYNFISAAPTEGSAVNNNTTAQRNTVGQKQRSKTTNQSSPKEHQSTKGVKRAQQSAKLLILK